MTLHPGAWLVWAGAAGLVAASTTNPFYLLPLAAAAWVVHAASGHSGPGRQSFRLFLAVAVVAVAVRIALVVFGPIGSGNVAAAALEGLRLGVLLIIFGTFNSVADPAGVLRLAPRRFHEASLAAALALSIAPRTLTAVARVSEAQHIRGLEGSRWRSLPALAVPVLQNGLADALVLAESMDARGHGRGRRSRYRAERPTAASLFIASIAAIAGVIFVAFGVAGAGDLAPSMAPVEWPGVSPVLLVGILLFASPAVIAQSS